MKNYCLLLLVNLCYLIAQAQSPCYWRLTDDDGLPNMEIYDLYQDSKGYMWIATDGGIVRYDGRTMIPYSHPRQKRNSTADIQEDHKGTIWYKNFAGQLFFIDEGVHLFELSDSIELGAYFNYAPEAEALVFSCSNYWYRYEWAKKDLQVDTLVNGYQSDCSDGIRFYHRIQKNTYAYVDCTEELWLRKNNQLYAKGKLPSNRTIRGLFVGLSADSVLFSVDNKVYINHIDSVQNPPTEEDFLLEHKGTTKLHRKRDSIVIGTQDSIFLLLKNYAQNAWYVHKRLPIPAPASTVCLDREGNIWLGTLGNGVFIIPSLDVHALDYDPLGLPPLKISALSKTTQGDLLIGMEGLVAKLNTHTLTAKVHTLDQKFPVLQLIPDEKRNQVLISCNGSHRIGLDFDTPVQSYPNLVGNNAILYQNDQLITGNFYNLTTFSLEDPLGQGSAPPSAFNGRISYTVNTLDPSYSKGLYLGHLSRERTTALWADQIDSNRFWAGINDRLFYFQEGIPHLVLAKDGADIVPMSIAQGQDGTVWVATTQQGIYGVLDGQVVHHFTSADGLPSNRCNTITVDGTQVWVGTDQGIAKITPPSARIAVYDQLDGLPSHQIDHLKIMDGQVWAATSKGLVWFGTNTPSQNPTPPNITLQQWQVNDSSYALVPTVLPYHRNNLQFTFQATALKSRNEYTYAYRLIGVDSQWVQQSSSTNFARFPNLNPGTYTFEVRASNEDGIPSTTATHRFTITPPYWKTWWFVSLIGGLIVVLLGGLLYGIYQFLQRRQATQHLIQQLKMQALQLQMNPHFIFNAMSTIQSFWLYKDSKTALVYHAKFAKLIRIIFNDSTKKSIPIEEEVAFLELYTDLEKIRLKDPIEVHFELDAIFEQEDHYLPPLLIQPIIENSFKHGFLHKEAPGQLWIKLKKEGQYIHCMVEDDGVGRAAAQTYQVWKDDDSSKHSSSMVTQERLELLNKIYGTTPNKTTYKITDLTNAHQKATGTRTELWIPILND